MLKDYYEINEDPHKLREAIVDLDGYWKTLSMLYIKKLGLPTLDGIIITRWNENVDLAITNFCKNIGQDRLLLRSDKKPEIPPYPRGGYLVKKGEIKNEAEKFFMLGRILIFLEPSDTFDNLYSILALFDNGEIILEILGPGFDASDLQRGDITPHEIIHVNRFKKKITDRIVLANNEEIYRESVKKRYLKIVRRLIDLGKINLSEDSSELHLIKKANRYLYENNHYYLLMNERRYQPIPDRYLFEILNYIYTFPEDISKYNKQNLPVVLSMGYIMKKPRLNFWDITWPKIKYEV